MSNEMWDGGCWVVLDRDCDLITGMHHLTEKMAHEISLARNPQLYVRRTERCLSHTNGEFPLRYCLELPMRILITGSRDWDDADRIALAIRVARDENRSPLITLIHGECDSGADKIADDVGHSLGLTIETYPAQWDIYGKPAGMIRNRVMVDTRPDLCLAFIKNHSPGSTMCAQYARKKGIKTIIKRA